jgi:hypothetical protein
MLQGGDVCALVGCGALPRKLTGGARLPVARLRCRCVLRYLAGGCCWAARYLVTASSVLQFALVSARFSCTSRVASCVRSSVW